MNTRNSLEILANATLTLNAALEKSPDLAERIDPTTHYPYRVSSDVGVVDTLLLAHWMSEGIQGVGIVLFRTQDGKFSLGISVTGMSEDWLVAGKLAEIDIEVSDHIKRWLCQFSSEKQWPSFLESLPEECRRDPEDSALIFPNFLAPLI